VTSDLSILSLTWCVRKFLLTLEKQPATGSYLACIPGTLPEVCDHLWSVQELFLKQILPTPGDKDATTTLLTLSLRELLDPNLDYDSGFYENAVCLDDNSALVVHLQLQLLPAIRLTTEGFVNLPMLHRNEEKIRPVQWHYVLRLRLVNSAANVRQLISGTTSGAEEGAREKDEDQLLAVRVRGIVQNARQSVFSLVFVTSWDEALETLRELQEQCVVLVNRTATEGGGGRLPPVREESDGDESNGYFVSPDDVSPTAVPFEIGNLTCSYPVDVRPLIAHVEEAMQVDDGVSNLLDRTMQLPVNLSAPALALPAGSVTSVSDNEETSTDSRSVLTFEASLEKRPFPPGRTNRERGGSLTESMDATGVPSPVPQEYEEVSPKWSPKMNEQNTIFVNNTGPSPAEASSNFLSAQDSRSVGEQEAAPNSFAAATGAIPNAFVPPVTTTATSPAAPAGTTGLLTRSGYDSAGDQQSDENSQSATSSALDAAGMHRSDPRYGHASWVDPDQKFVPTFLPNGASPGASSSASSHLAPLSSGNLAVVDLPFAEMEKRPHQWRLSIELRCMKLAHFQAKAFVKYFYPFVQQIKPFRTNPPTICRKNSTTYLPHGFAAYHFTDMSVAKLREKLFEPLNKTLRCEVWQRDPHTSDQILGAACMDLEQIMNIPEVTKQATDGFAESGSILPKVRTLDQTLPIISSSTGETQGTLRVVVFLEDLGECASNDFGDATGMPDHIGMDVEYDGSDARRGGGLKSAIAGGTSGVFGGTAGTAGGATSSSTSVDAAARLRSLPQYSAAYELELWKRAEEASFKVKLQEDERIRRLKLQDEYEDKEKRRSKEFAEKKQEVVALESQLRKKLVQLQQREAEVEAHDSDCTRKAEEAIRKCSILESETEAKVRLLKQEMSDELLLERDKVRRWEQKCATLEGECRQWQERYTGIENDFVKFRKQQFADDNSNPMEQIRADLKIKTFECKEAQKLVQQLRASRDHFKDSVTKLCAQVTGLEEEKRALEKDLYQKCAELRALHANATLRGEQLPSAMRVEQDAPATSSKTGGLDEGISTALRKIQEELKSLHDNYAEETPKPPPTATALRTSGVYSGGRMGAATAPQNNLPLSSSTTLGGGGLPPTAAQTAGASNYGIAGRGYHNSAPGGMPAGGFSGIQQDVYHGGAGGGDGGPVQHTQQPTSEGTADAMAQERQRLETLRRELLESGLYAEDDAIFAHMGL